MLDAVIGDVGNEKGRPNGHGVLPLQCFLYICWVTLTGRHISSVDPDRKAA